MYPQTNSKPNLAPLVILLILAALTYGSLSMTNHARSAHAAEAFSPSRIVEYFDGLANCGQADRIQTKPLPDGKRADWCEIKPGFAVGLILAAMAGGYVIVTGFMARCEYWRRIR